MREMDWWIECADYLLDISLILKSQRKLSLEEIDRLKRQTANYIKLWYPKIKDGGFILGHDVNQTQVRRAVRQQFGDTWSQAKQQKIWWRAV